jgi:hypothetical protein
MLRLLRLSVATAAVVLAVTAPTASAAPAGAPPNRLDRNLGVVLSAPRIHNLYWDANWSTNQPAFTRGAINSFSSRFGTSGYAGSLSQYGVGTPLFSSSHLASPLCGPTRAPNSVTTAAVILWILCEVNNPLTGVPAPVFRTPVSNHLYVVYLPRNTTISDSLTIPRFTVLGRTIGPLTVSHTSCSDYGAYHAFGAAATGLFAFAIVPTRCAVLATGRPAIDNVTLAASHEIVEAATDPLPLLSWVDNTLSTAQKLTRGEAADICDFLGAAPTRRQTFLWEPFWSNGAGRCVS